jgi:hypothetical protein
VTLATILDLDIQSIYEAVVANVLRIIITIKIKIKIDYNPTFLQIAIG